MDLLLRFKSRTHSQTFSSDLSIRLRNRFYLGLAVNGGYVILIINDITTHSSIDKKFMSSWCYTRLALVIIWTLLMQCFCRKTTILMRYANLIQGILDGIMVFCAATDFMWVTTNQTYLSAVDVRGEELVSWSTGLIFSCSLLLINSWIIRIVACIAKFIILTLVIYTSVDISNWKIGILAVVLIIQAYTVYNRERYDRIQHIERIKVFQDSQAVLKILDDITEGILIIDESRNIRYSNMPVKKIFQSSNPKLNHLFANVSVKNVSSTDKKFSTSYMGNQMAQCYEEISSFLLSLDNDRRECVTLEGTANFFKEFNARTYIVKFTNSNYNEKKVIVANITDTTDRDAVISLKLNNEYKSRLLASVSHELRTPLNGSINFTEEALNSPDVPESVKQKLLLPALRSSRMLLLLINDILDFSQMQANKLRLVFEKKNIVHIASECIELLEIQAAKKGVKLRLDSHLHRYQEKLLTDHNRVKQIILNLLSNAVKFTFQGQITITLEPKTIEGRRAVRISCADTGIGIDEENQKKLFKAFEKIDLKEKVSLNPTGVGLGLVISNNLAECLGQEANLEETTAINFKSKVGEGTTFWFDLMDQGNPEDHSSSLESPLEVGSQHLINRSLSLVELGSDKNDKEPKINLGFQRSLCPNIGNLSLKNGLNQASSLQHLETNPELMWPERASTLTAIRDRCTCPPVLVVDDDPFNIAALEQHLSKFNIKSDCAFNGIQAIEKIMHRHENQCSQNCSQYKIVFLDCNMPVLDGYQTARVLREKIAKGEIEPLKIIACTAFVQAAETEQALAAGMDDFCTKPITSQVVKQKVKDLIQ